MNHFSVFFKVARYEELSELTLLKKLWALKEIYLFCYVVSKKKCVPGVIAMGTISPKAWKTTVFGQMAVNTKGKSSKMADFSGKSWRAEKLKTTSGLIA